jgi:hypothetical protein
MRFDYKLTGAGWADIEIEVNGKEHFTSASYLSDPLDDLIRSLLTIIPDCVPKDELKTKVSFIVHQEPAVDKFTFEFLRDMKLRIIIEEFEDEVTKKSKIGFDVTCNLMDFLDEVLKSVDRLLIKFGFVGYKNTWCRKDFPIGSYLKLKYYLINRTSYPTMIELNDVEIPLEKSNLKDEIKIIIGE